MKGNKMAPADAETSARAAEQVMKNITTPSNACQIRISDLLRHGDGSPTSRRELEILTGWQPREVTRAIEHERRAGIPILANGSGYYLAAETAEVDQYLFRLAHREREIRRTRAAVAATRQLTMNLEGVD